MQTNKSPRAASTSQLITTKGSNNIQGDKKKGLVLTVTETSYYCFIQKQKEHYAFNIGLTLRILIKLKLKLNCDIESSLPASQWGLNRGPYPHLVSSGLGLFKRQ